MTSATEHDTRLAIVGGGPAGLMAAEVACAAGIDVDVYDGKGSVGRKFLIAGKGGLNLTHSEPKPAFVQRYRERMLEIAGWLRDFDADDLRDWAREFGVETFVGSSGRVFPIDLKAAPLLRGWVRRLRERGVRFHMHHRWNGWNDDGALRFDTPQGDVAVHTGATVLALGGGSWPQLGSDGAWQSLLEARGVDVRALLPSNCGFDIGWSERFAEQNAGAPLKPVVAYWRDTDGEPKSQQGECVVSATGIEGSLVYAMSAALRDTIARDGSCAIHFDLLPDHDPARVREALTKPRGRRSFSEHLRRQLGLIGAKAALLHETLDKAVLEDSTALALAIKRLPLKLRSARPIAEAISSAGGVRLEATNDALMIGVLPGVFCAGEMLDWEAPTGGYLLTACFASGRRAGLGAVGWLQSDHRNGAMPDPPADA
ncbi:MAG: TIGR03862 family flavoprotein [Luteimonas sp.]